ncbi:hypothetical protein [Methylomicrobium sp. Wu6]|uniref:hypothetical protein n=1 Tax=Methylomicrobium sp. Wu6 TaxID=3107928 RepID=UPI002DD671A8|nr:hypothetical protein [Methylomicrobium sp. Wu6]MEC4749081.1 hypothetical protein [Methylomicrobium sp. Wu6]
MTGFAEGLASGFKTVSDALNERDRTRVAEEEAQNQRDYKASQIGLQNLELQNKQDIQRHNDATLNETIRHNKATEANSSESTQGQNAERQARIGIDQMRAETDAAKAKKDAANIESQIQQRSVQNQRQNWETSLKQQQEARKQAFQTLNNVVTIDPSTEKMSLNVQPGQEGQVLDAMNKVGIPTQAINDNMQNYQRDVNVLKGALAHDNQDELRGKYGQTVMNAFNNVYGSSINQNVGQPYAGDDPRLKGLVEAQKVAVDALPVRSKDGKIVPHAHHIVIRSYFTDKDGNPALDANGQPLYEDGPMTVGRDNDPNAPLREVTAQELIRSLDAHQKFGEIMAQNPELVAQLRNLTKSQQKGGRGTAPKGYQSVVVPQGEDELGNKLPPSLQVINKDTGLTKDQEDEMFLRKNPENNSTSSPDAASQATMGAVGGNAPTQPGLYQALPNVGALH